MFVSGKMDFLSCSSPLSLYLPPFALFLLFFVFMFVSFLAPAPFSCLFFLYFLFHSSCVPSISFYRHNFCSSHLPESLSVELMQWLYRLKKRESNSLLPALTCVVVSSGSMLVSLAFSVGFFFFPQSKIALIGWDQHMWFKRSSFKLFRFPEGTYAVVIISC